MADENHHGIVEFIINFSSRMNSHQKLKFANRVDVPGCTMRKEKNESRLCNVRQYNCLFYFSLRNILRIYLIISDELTRMRITLHLMLSLTQIEYTQKIKQKSIFSRFQLLLTLIVKLNMFLKRKFSLFLMCLQFNVNQTRFHHDVKWNWDNVEWKWD